MPSANPFSHPVVFFINGLGDHLLVLPALRALAKLFPERLTVVSSVGMSSLFFRDVQFKRVIDCELDPILRSFDARSLAAAIGDCDLLLSPILWHSQYVDELLDLLRPRHSVGFFRSFHLALPRSIEQHAFELAFKVPQALARELTLDEFSQPPSLSPEAWSASGRIRDAIPSSLRTLVVHADTSREKMWPAESFVRVLDLFLDRHPEFMVLVVGQSGLPLDQGRHGERVILACDLPLATTFGLIAGASLFLGIDSCMLHAADLFRVPGVGLFGPTRSVEFGFRFAPHRHISGNGTMQQIDVDVVAQNFEELLAEHGR
jgi:ADP-heptose:LPS heptosyltransferase